MTISEDANEKDFTWVGTSNQVLWRKDVDHGMTKLWARDVENNLKRYLALMLMVTV